MNELIFRFVAGGGLVVLVSLLSKSRYATLAGLFMLFPVVTLVGYFFVGNSVDTAILHEITKFGIYTYPTTFAFMIGFYYTQTHYPIHASLGVGLLSWVVMAAVLIVINKTWLHIGA